MARRTGSASVILWVVQLLFLCSPKSFMLGVQTASLDYKDPNGAYTTSTIKQKLVYANGIDEVLEIIPKSMITNITQDEMQHILKMFADRQSITDGRTLKILRNMIFPGTKWCGPGSIAENDNDLGLERETDKCCRAHDHASKSIAPGQTKYGVTNQGQWTMTHCHDDCKFYNCLINVGSVTSALVGSIFFDGLGKECFAYGYPPKTNWGTSSKEQKWRTFPQPGFFGVEQLRDCTEYAKQPA